MPYNYYEIAILVFNIKLMIFFTYISYNNNDVTKKQKKWINDDNVNVAISHWIKKFEKENNEGNLKSNTIITEWKILKMTTEFMSTHCPI